MKSLLPGFVHLCQISKESIELFWRYLYISCPSEYTYFKILDVAKREKHIFLYLVVFDMMHPCLSALSSALTLTLVSWLIPGSHLAHTVGQLRSQTWIV